MLDFIAEEAHLDLIQLAKSMVINVLLGHSV